jgi:hypothetical protein
MPVPSKCGQMRQVADLEGWPTSHVLLYCRSIEEQAIASRTYTPYLPAAYSS